MIIKKLEGFVCLIWQDTPEGFSRGLPLEYIGFKPKEAIEIGEALAQAGRELYDGTGSMPGGSHGRDLKRD